MKIRASLVLFFFLSGLAIVRAAAPDQTRTEISGLLREFLANVDDPAMHARFWADDLVYTSGKGIVRTKAQILASVAAEQTSAAKGPRVSYEAADVLVRPYGDFAALTFRLVVHDLDGTTWYSRNSGAFLKRDGKWQVVTWQATREPEAATAGK